MKLTLRIFFYIFFFFSFKVFANESVHPLETTEVAQHKDNDLKKRKTFGHNMSPNSYTLSKGECVLSLYVSACGVGGDLILGTSPWILAGYNSYNVAARWGQDIDSDYRVGFQTTYMKNYTDSGHYIMESIRSHFILTKTLSPSSKIHYNLSYEYFFNETVPHSFRREPFNNDPSQLSLSALSEFDLSGDFIVQFETGIHGINYLYPHALLGFSVGKKWRQSYLQFGLSATGTPASYFSPSREDGNSKNYRTHTDGKKDFSVHPEMQWQYFL